MLSDGRWYTLRKIREKAGIDEKPLQQIMNFLNEYDFIVKDEAGKRVKLNKMIQEFLAQATTA